MDLITQSIEENEGMSKFCWFAASVNYIVIKKNICSTIVMVRIRQYLFHHSDNEFRDSFILFLETGIPENCDEFRLNYIKIINNLFSLNLVKINIEDVVDKKRFLKSSDILLLGKNTVGAMVSYSHALILMSGYFYEQFNCPYIVDGFNDNNVNLSRCSHRAKKCDLRGALNYVDNAFGFIFYEKTSNYYGLETIYKALHYYRNDFSDNKKLLITTSYLINFFSKY
ncbi:hypothetical protein [Francisella philomiragia]|uniref:hypothetical protein n=1 Tax=Francisella philomiragia TaxID=28110 RepID=UPI003518226F